MEGSILVAAQSGFSPQFRKPSFVFACNSKAMKLRVDVTKVLQASSGQALRVARSGKNKAGSRLKRWAVRNGPKASESPDVRSPKAMLSCFAAAQIGEEKR
jgi:hypothetical protein